MVDMRPAVAEMETDDVELADVRAFCRVVDLGSVTAAAASLGETKGSISRRLSRLEDALGLALLARSGRGVIPTEDGLLYRKKSGEALDLLDDARATLHDQRGVPTGHLRVTAPLGIGSQILGSLIAPFTAAYPKVTLELVLTDAVLSFERDRIDVALRLSAGLPDSSLVAHRLTPLSAQLVASPEYLAGAPPLEHPRDLVVHRLLLPPLRGQGTPLRFVPTDGGPAFEQVFRGTVLCHDLVLLREAARGGAGIAMMPRAMHGTDLVPAIPGWELSSEVGLWVVTAGGRLPPKVRVFRDFVREHVTEVKCTGKC